MIIRYTNHAEEKFIILARLGWKISKKKIYTTLEKPRWRGVSRFGQETAMDLLNHEHILRVIFDRKSDTILVITFHPARRGTYESTLR